MLSYVIPAVLLAQALATHVPFKDCGSKATVFYVDISPCDTADKCVLTQGNSYTISISFAPSIDLTKVSVKATATFWGQTIPLPVPQPNGCVASGLTCPVAGGSSQVYHTTIPIDATFPTTDMKIDVKLEDQNGDDQLCGSVQITIAA